MTTSEVYLKPNQSSKMQLFAKMVNGFQLTVFRWLFSRNAHLRGFPRFWIRTWTFQIYVRFSIHWWGIRLYNLTKIKNTIMISFAIHGISRVPLNLSRHLRDLHVFLVNQRNLIFPWLFKSHPVPSRLTSSIIHLIFYRHLGVLSLSTICGDFTLKTVYSTIIGESFKIDFQKYAPCPPGR